MRNLPCVGGCVFASLKDVISEHFYFIVVAMAVGAFFGASFGGITETLAGAGIGLLSSIV